MLAMREAGDVDSCAILTPYNGQVRLINNILRRLGLESEVGPGRPSTDSSPHVLAV